MVEAGTKRRISKGAIKVSRDATEEKDEFASDSILKFPVLTHSTPILADTTDKPLRWSYFVRVFTNNGSVRVPQLYIKATNRAFDPVVRYDTALLPGGDALPLNYINAVQEDDLFDTSSWHFVEHMGINLSPQFLSDYLDKPLRIKIHRPDRGVGFVVDVPSDYIAGVLHRLDPDDYEADPGPPPAAGAPRRTDAPGMAWLGTKAAVGMGLVGFIYSGAGLAAILAAVGFAIGRAYANSQAHGE